MRTAARELDGPRGQHRYTGLDLDTYGNLIVLCKNHHKTIDDLPEEYTVDRLKNIKAEHEKWVDIISPAVKRGKEPPVCYRITTGSQLWPILIDGEGWGFQHDDCKSEQELRLIGGFLQSLEDYIEFGDSLESMQRSELQFEWSQKLNELESAGFAIYGGQHTTGKIMLSGTVMLHICYIQILRITLLRANMGLASESQPLPKAIVLF